MQSACRLQLHAGGVQVGRAVANAAAGGAAACSRHAGGACRWGMQGARCGQPPQGVQLHAVGMQAACRQHACRQGMQAAFSSGALWPTPPQGARCGQPPQGVQLHAVGMQAACSRHAGSMQAGHAGGVQAGRAVANDAARGSRHASGMQAGHAGGMQVGRIAGDVQVGGALWPTPPQGVQLHAVGTQAACKHAGEQATCRWDPPPPNGDMHAAVGVQVKAPWTRQNCQAKFNQILVEFLCEF